jgi:CheY-like chemotaxis protein
MSDLVDIVSTTDSPFKILIIDDEPIWHMLIGGIVESLGYIWESASNFEEAKIAIKEAEENKSPFSVVTIDVIFKIGEDKQPFDLGTEMILQYIKSKHPYLACILISASSEVAHNLLDLRDNYELDYYVSKGRLNKETLAKAIVKSVKRVRPLGDSSRRREVLEETLERYRDICAIYARNLAIVEQKKAQKGIDVSVEIEHQIVTYGTELEKAKSKVRETMEELKHLS